jgi:hypothetical protein
VNGDRGIRSLPGQIGFKQHSLQPICCSSVLSVFSVVR